MPKLERDYYAGLVKGAIAEGWALFRIGDGAWGKKPCDIAGCDPYGFAVALEVKRIKSPHPLNRPLPWHLFTGHQLAWLESYARRPAAIALVALVTDQGVVTVFELHTPDFKTVNACELSPTELVAVKGNVTTYICWREVLRKRDRRQVVSVLESL
jgi:hypothetical protein